MNSQEKRSSWHRIGDALSGAERPIVEHQAAQAVARELNEQSTVTGWERSVATQTDTAFRALRRNSLLNFLTRLGLYSVGITAFAWAVWYVGVRGDDMVGVLINNEGGKFSEDKLLALVVPVLLMAALAATALLAALYIQSRGVSDFESGLDGISRLRREAQAGVSRSRTLTHIVEEFVDNARRAFRLQLWLARALFIICLILFTGAVANAVAEGEAWISTVMAGGSLGALLLAVLRGAPQDVGNRLADSTQLQVVVSSSTRELNMIEEYVYKTMEAKDNEPEAWKPAVEHGVEQMKDLTAQAMNLIQLYVEPEGDAGQQARQVGIENGQPEGADASGGGHGGRAAPTN